jgi:hypothetical protein
MGDQAANGGKGWPFAADIGRYQKNLGQGACQSSNSGNLRVCERKDHIMKDYALNRGMAAESIGTSLFTLFCNWRVRRQVAALAKCNDKSLEELGFNRDKVLWAIRLPLSQNSQLALEGCAFMRARH